MRFGETAADFSTRPHARELRLYSERATPSAGVGNRSSTRQAVWNKSNRCAGARGGARVGRPRWLRILTITGGSSMAAMIFKAPAQFGQWSMSKTRLSKRAQLRRARHALPVSGIG